MPRQVIFELSELKQTNAGDRKGGKDDWMADRVQLPRGLHNGYVTEQNTRNVTSKDLVSMPGFGSSWGDCDGSKEHESLDFDTVNTPFWVDSSRHPHQRGIVFSFRGAIVRSKVVYQWLFTVAIGVGVALVAQLVQVSSVFLVQTRNQQMQRYYEADRPDTEIFVFFAGYNAVLVVIAGVLARSSATGDGVPEVKAYLNGSHIHGCFHIHNMLKRVVGTVLVNAAALASGPEGPLIHIGAGLAYAVTCAESLSTVMRTLTPSVLPRFTNDRERSEFIAAGAGAGIAAAFGAPIGGVLFALEETASHWSPQLIWRIFTSAMVATFTLALIRAGGNSGDISLAGLLSSGTKISLKETKGGMMDSEGSLVVSIMDAPVYVWELTLFVVLGALGGMLGGLFNASYSYVARLRPKSRSMQVLEVLFLSLLTSYVLFFLAAFFPRCRDNGTWTCRDADNSGDHCSGVADNTTCVGMRAVCVNATGWMCVGGDNNGLACRGRAGFEDCLWRGGQCLGLHQVDSVFGLRAKCDVGQYDELATLFFGDKSSSIVRMVSQSAPSQNAPFSNQSLLIAAAAYQVLMIATYGAPLNAGTFMPSWLVGAALGRLFGQLVNVHISCDDCIYSGAYALTGAAAVLGGVHRASISLIFFIVEGTSNVHFLLPIVTTLLSANVVSRLFTREGVFDLALRHHAMRFLPHNPHRAMQISTVSDVCGGPVRTLRAVESIGRIVDVLRSCHHNGFPVVDMGALVLSPMDTVASSSCFRTRLKASHNACLHQSEGPPRDDRRNENTNSGCDFSTGEIAGRGSYGEALQCQEQTGRLEGLILRSHLRHLLSARFMRNGGTPNSLWQRITFAPSASPRSSARELPLAGDPEMYEVIEYGRRCEEATAKEWEWGLYGEEDRSRLVNLAAYMNAACYSVQQGCTVARAYTLFRSMGLRHLPVVDAYGAPMGMLTRANFGECTLQR